MADAVGMNHETVRRYLNGHAPSAEFLAKVCEIYEINGSWLLVGKGPSTAHGVQQELLRTASQADLLGTLAARLISMESRLARVEQSLLDGRSHGEPPRRIASRLS